MSKKKAIPVRPVRKKSVKQAVIHPISKSVTPSLTLFVRIDKFLDSQMNKIFWASFGLTLLSGLLLFDIRISTSGDDSAYIMRADDLIHHFILPGFQGPFYPIVLSPFIGIFGIRVVLLKFISLLFMLGFTGITYKAFKGRIPALLLTGMLFLVCVNSYILYYASQTYSEACFMFLQALTFLVFFKFFIEEEKEAPFIMLLRQHFVLAICVLGLALTRSIGFAAVFAITGYFLFKGQWKNLLGFTVSFMLVMTVFEAFKFLVWRSPDVNFTVQIQSLMSKNYYNPAMGREDIMGFVHRLVANSNQYFSKYLYTIIGLREQDDSMMFSLSVTVLTWLMLLASVILTLRKNKYIFFTTIYTIVFLFITFLIAHTSWGQSRFIIPYIPLILLVFLALFYFVLGLKQLSTFQWLLPVFVIIIFILTISTTIPRVIAARQVEDRYWGLTPDWKNYCKISEWASANLPQDALVACRKPSISFIYSHGKRFYGIMRLLSYPGDSVLVNWQQKQLHYYLISASSINNNPVSKELYFAFKNSIVGYGFNNDENTYNVRFYIMDFPDSIKTRTLNELNRSKINATSDFDSLKVILNDPGSRISIIYPDSLLQMLLKAKVTHVLTANLRTSDQKTASTNMTVERFMSYIEFKYPGIRTKIMQVGSDDDEPASIYKLNYELYGFRLTN